MPAMRLLAGLAFAAACIHSAAAASVGAPSPEELDAVRAGKLAVALYRVRTVIDGKVDASSPRMYLANLDDLQAPRLVTATSLSEAARSEGWRHLLVPPGTYYLLVVPPGLDQNPPAVMFHAPTAKFGRMTQYRFEPGRKGFWSPELSGFVLAGPAPADFRELSGFWFRIPEGSAVVDLGVLSISCTAGRGLFGNLIDSCTDYEVLADPRLSRQIAAAALPVPGEVHDSPFVPYGTVKAGIRVPEGRAIRVAVPGTAALGGAYTGARIGPWGVVHGVTRGISIYNLGAIAGYAIGRLAEEREAAKRTAGLQPCLENLSKALPAIDYATRFAAAMGAVATGSAGTGGGAPSDASDSGEPLLTVSVPILHLRESAEPDHLSLELGVHARLGVAGSAVLAYVSLLVHAEAFPPQNPLQQGSRLYARLTPERARPRPVSDWCGPEGASILMQEIEAGLRHVAAQLDRDLRQAR